MSKQPSSDELPNHPKLPLRNNRMAKLVAIGASFTLVLFAGVALTILYEAGSALQITGVCLLVVAGVLVPVGLRLGPSTCPKCGGEIVIDEVSTEKDRWAYTFCKCAECGADYEYIRSEAPLRSSY